MSEDVSSPELTKVEVTPEMIRVGVEIFTGFDDSFEAPEHCVREIFEAMMKVSQEGQYIQNTGGCPN